ncbi:MAG: hypothetical protein QGG80_09350 [Candidatus Krumholzibacteria bacterium]|jgi:hypothetical protein|nr:hypothetical protein [Candidatus Krumholzibacteria bacterium]MDP7022258.1 hypothetical protein [Candidatus Krumholzibacteria bacterium]
MKILIHGLAILFSNFAAIYLGFLAWYLLRPGGQLAVQVPLAALLSILGILLWFAIARRCRWMPGQQKEWIWIYLASLIWNPLVFVPLHYISQGYLTGTGNILALWTFQIPVNLLALFLARSVLKPVEK